MFASVVLLLMLRSISVVWLNYFGIIVRDGILSWNEPRWEGLT